MCSFASLITFSAAKPHMGMVEVISVVTDDPDLCVAPPRILEPTFELAPRGTVASGVVIEHLLQPVIDEYELHHTVLQPMLEQSPLGAKGKLSGEDGPERAHSSCTSPLIIDDVHIPPALVASVVVDRATLGQAQIMDPDTVRIGVKAHDLFECSVHM